jgi:tRNA dimethylallyltransferase
MSDLALRALRLLSGPDDQDGQTAWLIAGPTASGKSALALALAVATGGEIVNADSMQVYADLRILTARPSPHEEAAVPHHLYGCADAAGTWSVGRWLAAVREVLPAIRGRGRRPIFVGGTGLYFRALTAGLAEIPAVAAGIREDAQAALDAMGEPAFRERLAEVDPAAAARVAPGDRQRLTRAYEVWLASGRSLSDWQEDAPPLLSKGAWRGLVVEPPRAELYARCDARLAAMVQAGAIEETARLIARRLPASAPAMKALGVAAFAAHLRGELSLEEAISQAQMDIRRYAKRQLTWFRNQTADWPRV